MSRPEFFLNCGCDLVRSAVLLNRSHVLFQGGMGGDNRAQDKGAYVC